MGWREAKGRSREAGGAILVYSRRAVVVAASGGSAGVAFAILPTGSSRKVGVGLVRGCGPHTVPPRFVLAPFPPFFSLTVKRALSRVSPHPRSHAIIRLASPRSFLVDRIQDRVHRASHVRAKEATGCRLEVARFFFNGPLRKRGKKEGRREERKEERKVEFGKFRSASFRKNDQGKVDNR